jgi:hypothetical protein
MSVALAIRHLLMPAALTLLTTTTYAYGFSGTLIKIIKIVSICHLV